MSPLEQAAEVIQRGDRFLLTCHLLPDADALGSMLGLAVVLRELGKDVYLFSCDPIPPKLAFLPGSAEVRSELPAQARFDGTLITDTAARNLLSDSFPPPSVSGPVIMIDHHLVHDDFGDVLLRDGDACATAIVVLRLAAKLGVWPVPLQAAMPLYTAIVADTGGFRYPGTTSATLRVAADLLDAGIDPWHVASNVFENWPMARLRLLGAALHAMELLSSGRLALICIPSTMVEAAGASERMVDGLVEYGRMLRGVDIAVMLWERSAVAHGSEPGPRTRLSLRSAGQVNVASIAQKFGGGGHRAAAGATLVLELAKARERVLDVVHGVLAEDA